MKTFKIFTMMILAIVLTGFAQGRNKVIVKPHILPSGKGEVEKLCSVDLDNQTRNIYTLGYEQFAARTENLPEERYEFMALLDPNSGGDMIELQVRQPQSLILISPHNGAKLSPEEKYPTFTWTPPRVSSLVGTKYQLRIVEILPGQTKEEAMKSNKLWYEGKSIAGSSFLYPLSAKAFEPGKQFAWQVQALNRIGMIIGKSEIRTFTSTSPIGMVDPDPPGIVREKQTKQPEVKNPFLPVIMHSIERFLMGVTDLSEMDRIVQDALKRHPRITPEMLKTWVENWKAVPESTKAKLVPKELLNLNPMRKLDMQLFRATLIRYAPVIPCGGPLPKKGERLSTSIPKEVMEQMSRGTLRDFAGDIERMEKQPHITSMEPEAWGDMGHMGERYWFTQGAPFTIHGRNFSLTKEENNIRFCRLIDGSLAERVAVTPLIATATRLEVQTPTDIEPGGYEIQVTTPQGQSNLVHCGIGRPSFSPRITSIAPASQYPGKNVLITGTEFRSPAHVRSVKWESLDRDGLRYFYSYEWNAASERDAAFAGYPPAMGQIPFTDGYLRWVHHGSGSYSYPTPTAHVLSDTQLELSVPYEILPGHYRIQIDVGAGSTDWTVLDILAPSYRVVFESMGCIDEAKDNTSHNEIVTQWGISADGNVWSKNTGEYGNVNRGDVIPYGGPDRAVYLPDGGAGEVREYLLINTALYEGDRGEIETATQVLGFVADIAEGVTDWLTGGGEIGGVAFGEIISFAFDAVASLIGTLCGEEADLVGEENRAWTAVDLQLWTSNSARRYAGWLPIGFYLGGGGRTTIYDDDKGAFEVYFFIQREP